MKLRSGLNSPVGAPLVIIGGRVGHLSPALLKI